MKRAVAMRALAVAAAGAFALSACGSSDTSCGSAAGFKAPDGFAELERRRYDDTEFTFVRLS